MITLRTVILPVHKHGVSFHFWCLLQFISSVSYHFQCTDLSLPWLSLFLVILLLDAIVNRVVFLISFPDNSLLLHRNTIDYLILILYHAALLNSFIGFNIFFFKWDLQDFLYMVLCHLPYFFGFPVRIPVLFLVWLLWLGLPILCWIKVVRVGIRYCFWS